MSKIGKQPIPIPKGVEVKTENNSVTVKGLKGSLFLELPAEISIELKEGTVVVKRVGNSKNAAALWGLTRALLANMVTGVTAGHQKQLELQGVGYHMNFKGKQIEFVLGFSHHILIDIPEGIEATIEKNILTIRGIDKALVGQFAANVRALRKADPYKGKGLRYVGEHVRRKEGKKVVAAAA